MKQIVLLLLVAVSLNAVGQTKVEIPTNNILTFNKTLGDGGVFLVYSRGSNGWCGNKDDWTFVRFDKSHKQLWKVNAHIDDPRADVLGIAYRYEVVSSPDGKHIYLCMLGEKDQSVFYFNEKGVMKQFMPLDNIKIKTNDLSISKIHCTNTHLMISAHKEFKFDEHQLISMPHNSTKCTLKSLPLEKSFKKNSVALANPLSDKMHFINTSSSKTEFKIRTASFDIAGKSRDVMINIPKMGVARAEYHVTSKGYLIVQFNENEIQFLLKDFKGKTIFDLKSSSKEIVNVVPSKAYRLSDFIEMGSEKIAFVVSYGGKAYCYILDMAAGKILKEGRSAYPVCSPPPNVHDGELWNATVALLLFQNKSAHLDKVKTNKARVYCHNYLTHKNLVLWYPGTNRIELYQEE
jgi:hypothetical protein